jgi:hypothetical protein
MGHACSPAAQLVMQFLVANVYVGTARGCAGLGWRLGSAGRQIGPQGGRQEGESAKLNVAVVCSALLVGDWGCPAWEWAKHRAGRQVENQLQQRLSLQHQNTSLQGCTAVIHHNTTRCLAGRCMPVADKVFARHSTTEGQSIQYSRHCCALPARESITGGNYMTHKWQVASNDKLQQA